MGLSDGAGDRYETLNARQQLYVDLRCQGKSKCEAYTAAGFKGDPGGGAPYNLDKRLEDVIADRMADISDEAAHTARQVLEEIDMVAFLKPDELKAWPAGRLRDKVRALELAAKRRGQLTERQIHAFEEPVRLYVPEIDSEIPGAAPAAEEFDEE